MLLSTVTVDVTSSVEVVVDMDVHIVVHVASARPCAPVAVVATAAVRVRRETTVHLVATRPRAVGLLVVVMRARVRHWRRRRRIWNGGTILQCRRESAIAFMNAVADEGPEFDLSRRRVLCGRGGLCRNRYHLCSWERRPDVLVAVIPEDGARQRVFPLAASLDLLDVVGSSHVCETPQIDQPLESRRLLRFISLSLSAISLDKTQAARLWRVRRLDDGTPSRRSWVLLAWA